MLPVSVTLCVCLFVSLFVPEDASGPFTARGECNKSCLVICRASLHVTSDLCALCVTATQMSPVLFLPTIFRFTGLERIELSLSSIGEITEKLHPPCEGREAGYEGKRENKTC